MKKVSWLIRLLSPLVNQLLDSFTLSDAIGQAVSDQTIEDQFTFSTNRDTLVDVLNLITDITATRVWFVPDGERGLKLRAVVDDSQQYDLTPSSNGPPRVIGNNALYEMRPFNAVKLKGATKKLLNVGPLTVDSPYSSQYAEAVATYPPLVERYGGKLQQESTSQLVDSEQLEQEAAARLSESLADITGGSMTLTLSPMIRPYDSVEATPACSGVTASVSPLVYGVQEATHRIVPSNNNLPQTEIQVSLSVEQRQIETTSTKKDTETGSEPTDEPAYEGYELRAPQNR